jgi:hypothetical protein
LFQTASSGSSFVTFNLLAGSTTVATTGVYYQNAAVHDTAPCNFGWLTSTGTITLTVTVSGASPNTYDYCFIGALNFPGV